MQENKIDILSTRLLDRVILDKAGENGIAVDAVPFIEIQHVLSPEITGQIKMLGTQKIVAVFTSMHAATAVAEQLSTKPEWVIYCIGGATKDLVNTYFGKNAVTGTAKSAAALAEKIIGAKNIKEIFFFCGDHRLDELPEILSRNNIEVNELVVYTTILLPQVIERDYAGILFFSPSAVHSFFLSNTVSIKTIFFSIGKTTTACIRTYCTNVIITSEWPGQENMIAKVIEYYKE